MYRNKFFKNKKSLCPISNRTKTVKSLFINHLLQHTIICLSNNGEIPSALSYQKCSALQLESDIPQKATLMRLSPVPALSWNLALKVLSLSQPFLFLSEKAGKRNSRGRRPSASRCSTIKSYIQTDKDTVNLNFSEFRNPKSEIVKKLSLKENLA